MLETSSQAKRMDEWGLSREHGVRSKWNKLKAEDGGGSGNDEVYSPAVP